MYSVEKTIREQQGKLVIFDYVLLNEFNIVVGKFHDEKLACKVRDLLNKDIKEGIKNGF